MVKVKKFKLSYPNTGLLFIIAGLAVGNYSYEKYQREHLNKGNSPEVKQGHEPSSDSDKGMIPEALRLVQDPMLDDDELDILDSITAATGVDNSRNDFSRKNASKSKDRSAQGRSKNMGASSKRNAVTDNIGMEGYKDDTPKNSAV